jgi:hypothetical protein
VGGGSAHLQIEILKSVLGESAVHRRTVYQHPEDNSDIERFHRSLKEQEVSLNEYQNFNQAS